VDLLYHEATFCHDMLAHAEKTGHSTAAKAAEIAAAAQVGQLLVGHYSTRYDSLVTLYAEAKAVFPNTLLAADGLTVAVEYRAISVV
jgi:ribonuclease Z